MSGRFLHKSGSSVSWHPNPKQTPTKTDDVVLAIKSDDDHNSKGSHRLDCNTLQSRLMWKADDDSGMPWIRASSTVGDLDFYE